MIELSDAPPATFLEKDGATVKARIVPYRQRPQELDTSSWHTHVALIDTGAERTAIDSRVAENLNLERLGAPVEQAGVGGKHKSQVVRGEIHLPEYGVVVRGLLMTAPLRESRAPYDALLGRDFLREARFVYDGLGKRFDLRFGDSARDAGAMTRLRLLIDRLAKSIGA